MDGKQRNLMLAKLRNAKNYWTKKAYEKRNMNSTTVPNNVMPFPGSQNIQQATTSNGVIFNGEMPKNVVPFPSNPNNQQNDAGNERRSVLSRGTDPRVGDFYKNANQNPDQNINGQFPMAGFANGLILAGITFVTELLFLAISYFMFK